MKTIDAELVRKLLSYDPLTGMFTWLARSPDMFEGNRSRDESCLAWNARNAGRQAGTRGGDGYVIIRILRKNFKAHRLAFLIMTGKFPSAQIDHINLHKSDNRWDNIRSCNNSENMQNRPIYKSNTSGYTGVHKRMRDGKWKVKIAANNKDIYIGAFENKECAYAAYVSAKARYHPFSPSVQQSPPSAER